MNDTSTHHHTRGKWFIGIDTEGCLSVFSGAEHPQKSQVEAGCNAACICKVAPPSNQTDEDQANARLIATAPEMFAELQSILRTIQQRRDEMPCSIVEHEEDIAALIAKATGGAK